MIAGAAAVARRQLIGAGRVRPTAQCRPVSFVTVGCWRSAVAAPSRRCAFCSGPQPASKPSGAGSGPTPEPLLARVRARVLSALQKDGGKELDTSLPLGATLRRIFAAATPELPLLVAAGKFTHATRKPLGPL